MHWPRSLISACLMATGLFLTVRPAWTQPTPNYIPFPPTAANLLRGDVDLTPRIVGGAFTPTAYLPARNNLLDLNTITGALATLGLPSPTVRGVDIILAPDGQKAVLLTVGHVTFLDATMTPPGVLAIYPNTDTPISDCDPLWFATGGGNYVCIVPYVGSVRVLSVPAVGPIADLYTIPRSSIGIDAVDPVILGNMCAVPNVTSVDFFNINTGVWAGTTAIYNQPKREIDMVPVPAIGRIYWALDGALYRFNPSGPAFVDAITPFPGSTIEGSDLAVGQPSGGYPMGYLAIGVSGFVNIFDLASGALIAAAPTPGAVIPNHDVLVTPWNLTGFPDGVIYWDVIGTTYAVDMSAPWAPTAAIPTPGALINGCDLTASNDMMYGVLPHPGFVHVIDLSTATLVGPGVIMTPGSLREDVDPIFPTPPVDPVAGSRVVQPYLGGILIVSNLTGAPTECVVTTTTTVYVLDLAAMIINTAFPVGTTVEGVDPVIAQGAISPFDYNPNTLRDIDQDFLCNRQQTAPYWWRPWYIPYWPIRSPWWSRYGIPMNTMMMQLRAFVLSDQMTVAFTDPRGIFVDAIPLRSAIVGGFVWDPYWRYGKVYLRDRSEAIFDLSYVNPLTFLPSPVVNYVSFPGVIYWPPAHDYWNGHEIMVSNYGYRLQIVNSMTAAVVQEVILPHPAIHPVAMDYKNKLCSVLLKSNYRCILDLHPLALGMPASVTINRFYAPRLWWPVCNTVYDPMNLCALNLYYDPLAHYYGIYAWNSLTGAYLWHQQLPYKPYGRIFIERKSKLAKVPLYGGYEFLMNLGPLAWGASPYWNTLYIGYPWTFEPAWDFYNRWEINVYRPNMIVIVDAYRMVMMPTIYTPYPIIGPPVIDGFNKYMRVRLSSGHSYFVDLFKLAAGITPYYRLDSYAPDLADDAIFDPDAGIDLAVTTGNKVMLTRSRTGASLGAVTLPGTPVRTSFNPDERSATFVMSGGSAWILDLSEVDDSGTGTPALYPANTGGPVLAGTDLTAPSPCNMSLVSVSSPIGGDGLADVSGNAGAVEPNAYVALVNQTDESVEPVEVNADETGAFRGFITVTTGDELCVITSDVNGNVSTPACMTVTSTVSGVDDGPGGPPAATALLAPKPNPFKGAVEVRFTLAAASSEVRVDVFDVSGRLVRSLVKEPLEAGTYTRGWNGQDDAGRQVGAGVYFIKMSGVGAGTGGAAGQEHVQRVVRVK